MADAYSRFHEKLLANQQLFPQLASFDAANRVNATQGTFAWQWGAHGEVQETTNTLNAWGVRLHEWGAWNLVIDSYRCDEEKWEVFYHFMEPLAFYCMLQPSSLADRITVAAETLLHQANQFVFSEQRDHLAQDDLSPGRTLPRTARRKQLSRLGKHWTAFPEFYQALNVMAGDDYQKATCNFRDLSAHSFAPRLMTGQVIRAIRSIVPKTELVLQPCGGYLPVEDPTRRCVQYAMQSQPPLDLNATRAANLAEHQKALVAMKAFSSLICELCDQMEAKQKHAI